MTVTVSRGEIKFPEIKGVAIQKNNRSLANKSKLFKMSECFQNHSKNDEKLRIVILGASTAGARVLTLILGASTAGTRILTMLKSNKNLQILVIDKNETFVFHDGLILPTF